MVSPCLLGDKFSGVCKVLFIFLILWLCQPHHMVTVQEPKFGNFLKLDRRASSYFFLSTSYPCLSIIFLKDDATTSTSLH